MIKYENIKEAQEAIVDHWGDKGKEVVVACYKVNPFNKNFTEFLKECTACGGNWGGMLLTGIKKLYPDVYNAIPDDMGAFAWSCLCYTLLLCGVDTTES